MCWGSRHNWCPQCEPCAHFTCEDTETVGLAYSHWSGEADIPGFLLQPWMGCKTKILTWKFHICFLFDERCFRSCGAPSPCPRPHSSWLCLPAAGWCWSSRGRTHQCLELQQSIIIMMLLLLCPLLSWDGEDGALTSCLGLLCCPLALPHSPSAPGLLWGMRETPHSTVRPCVVLCSCSLAPLPSAVGHKWRSYSTLYCDNKCLVVFHIYQRNLSVCTWENVFYWSFPGSIYIIILIKMSF